MAETFYQCQNCETLWPEDQLVTPIEELAVRVLPGEFMPAGECPLCKAVCHEMGNWNTLMTVYLDGGGDLQFHIGDDEKSFELDLGKPEAESCRVLRRFFIHGEVVKEDGETEPISVRE